MQVHSAPLENSSVTALRLCHRAAPLFKGSCHEVTEGLNRGGLSCQFSY